MRSFGSNAGLKRHRYCESCPIRERALCSALSSPASEALGAIAHFKHFPAGQVLQTGPHDPSWFAVIITGVVKLVKTLPDGRQQIVGLQFPADFLGRPFAAANAFRAEATTSLLLCCFPKSDFEAVMQEHPCLEGALLRLTLDQLDQAREWMFTLGRKTAQERMASLLFLIAERMRPLRNGSEGEIEFDLPLSRIDMADCLGLTHETVSRELRGLRDHGIIATRGRRSFVVPQLAALKQLAHGKEC
jgi:CRP/FNR family transcriptional regulator, anaerobic regulatory protein